MRGEATKFRGRGTQRFDRGVWRGLNIGARCGLKSGAMWALSTFARWLCGLGKRGQVSFEHWRQVWYPRPGLRAH